MAIGEVQRVVVYSINEKAPNGAFFLTFEVSKDLEGFLPLLPLLGICNHELLSVDFKIFFSSSAVADLRNLTLIFDAIVILISDPKDHDNYDPR